MQDTVTRRTSVTRVLAVLQLAADLTALVRRGERLGLRVRVDIHGIDGPTFDDLPGDCRRVTPLYRSKRFQADDLEDQTLRIDYYSTDPPKGGGDDVSRE